MTDYNLWLALLAIFYVMVHTGLALSIHGMIKKDRERIIDMKTNVERLNNHMDLLRENRYQAAPFKFSVYEKPNDIRPHVLIEADTSFVFPTRSEADWFLRYCQSAIHPKDHDKLKHGYTR